MNPFSSFDKVIYLNLVDRQDRNEICLETFNKYNINNFERFEGIKVGGGAYEHFSSKKIGQIGCCLSFSKMINKAIDENLNNVLFLEDDFEFQNEPLEFNQEINKCLDELPHDWDAFYLGANVIDHFTDRPLENYSNHLLRLRSAYALHSVAFSKKGLIKIREYFGNDKDWGLDLIREYEAIDVFFAQVYQDENLCFIPRERLLSLQRPDFSSIESTFFDYTDLMVQRFRYFKELI